jgi:hypothetical protein
MTRLERRKRSRARKDAKAAKLNARALSLLNAERTKAFYSDPMQRIASNFTRSPKGMGNAPIYRGTCYPAPGYGTGAFKERPLSERQCRELRSQER